MFPSIEDISGVEPHFIEIRRYAGLEDSEDVSYYQLNVFDEVHPVGFSLSVTGFYVNGEEVPFEQVVGEHAEGSEFGLKKVITLPDKGTSELLAVLERGYRGPVELDHQEL